jgi:sugar lactone lactonase YvrE
MIRSTASRRRFGAKEAMMQKLLRWLAVLTVLIAGWAAPPPRVGAAILSQAANRVVGQPDFTHNNVNNGGLSANSLSEPVGAAVDAHGNLYVADTLNNRVLEYDAPLTTTHAAATRVIGQPDFTSNDTNNGGLSANSLNQPTGVAVDAQGNLYVADNLNNRVLEYDAPLAITHTAATRVIGQPDFSHNTFDNGGVSGQSLGLPYGVAVDAHGNLYVADGNNQRVLEYAAPLTTTHAAATRVIGQPDFTHNTFNNGGISASSLAFPFGVTVDVQGNLYVADFSNNRVLEYDAPLAITDTAAARVIGQPDFASNSQNNGGLSASSLFGPEGVTVDAHDNLYVADTTNSRALEYDAPLSTYEAATRLIGQPAFTDHTSNNGGLSANSLADPTGVAVDAHGNLYVADANNTRVLEYDRLSLPLALFLPLVLR